MNRCPICGYTQEAWGWCPRCSVRLEAVRGPEDDADGDLWEQAVIITREHAARILAEKGDRQ